MQQASYWFPAKRYGWGWGLPSSWQGWVVLSPSSDRWYSVDTSFRLAAHLSRLPFAPPHRVLRSLASASSRVSRLVGAGVSEGEILQHKPQLKLLFYATVSWLFVGLSCSPALAQTTPASAYAASTDLRKFVDERAASPQSGSFFYAYWARWECADDGQIARRIAREVRPPPASQQGKAVQLELLRCRNLPPELSAGASQRQDVQDGRAIGDKLFAAFEGTGGPWFLVEDQTALLRALRFLTPNEDPNMSWVVAQKLAGLGAAQRLAIGRDRLSAADGRSLHVAFLLAACDINVDCGSSHRWMRTWCVQNAECDDSSLEAYWRRTDGIQRKEMDWPTIAKYRAQIVAAVKANDWSLFTLMP